VIRDNAGASRFELDVEGAIAYVDYHREGNVVHLDYAKVPEQLAGRGLGARLARETLQFVAQRGERVVPVCGFIVKFMREHPEFDALRMS
jgi:predicted GNAT family acetyltransferase